MSDPGQRKPIPPAQLLDARQDAVRETGENRIRRERLQRGIVEIDKALAELGCGDAHCIMLAIYQSDNRPRTGCRCPYSDGVDAAIRLKLALMHYQCRVRWHAEITAARIAELEAVLPLARFGALCLREHRNDGDPGDVDGAWLEEQAIGCGLLQWQPQPVPCDGCEPNDHRCFEDVLNYASGVDDLTEELAKP